MLCCRSLGPLSRDSCDPVFVSRPSSVLGWRDLDSRYWYNCSHNATSTESSFHVPLDTRYVNLEMFFPADHLALYWIHSTEHKQATENKLTPANTKPKILNLTHTHTRLTALFPRLPGWAGTRKVKLISILLKQDSEWQWHQLGHMQVCTSLQTDNHASTHHSVFYRPDALPAAQPTASKHWRQQILNLNTQKMKSKHNQHTKFVCVSLCTTVAHDTAQTSSDHVPS